MNGLTAMDILVLTLLGLGAVRGFARGFVAEALGLVAWLFGVVCVRMFSGPAAVALDPYIGNEWGTITLAMILTFGIPFAIGKGLAATLGKASRNSVLGPVDRALGIGFGVLKGLVIASLAFLVIALGYDLLYGGDEQDPKWMTESRTYPLLNASSKELSELIARRREEKSPVPVPGPTK